MNTRHLSLFLQVMRTGSMTKVADELQISQPAISTQMKRFEEEMGIPLFTSHGRGVIPTDAGETCMEYAEAILGLESQFLRAMEEFRQGKRGRIVIAASAPTGTYVLPEYLASFKNRHADIQLDLRLFPGDDIEKLVQEGHADIGITFFAPREHLGLRVTRFLDDEWICIGSPSHPNSKTVYVPRGCQPPIVDDLTSNCVELDTTETVKRFVLYGMGSGIVPYSSVVEELKLGTFTRNESFESQPISLSLITRPAERLSVSLWLFIDHLQSEARLKKRD